MYEQPISVLIAGAGPTGLTLAIELARRGVPVRIVDAAEGPRPGSRGKGLQPRTLEIFHSLGVIDSILGSGAPYPRFRFHAGPLSLRGPSLGGTRQATESMPYPNAWLIPQCKTEQILLQRLEALGGRVEFGVAVNTLLQHERGVSVQLSNGELVEADYLVGCDGARSVVRKALGLELIGEGLGDEPRLVADIAVPGLDPSNYHVWPLARGGALALCPLPGGNLFQLLGAAALEQRGLEASVKAITGFDVESVAWRSVYRPQVRMVQRYRVGRVLLAGDAAHVHPPSGGQGLNTGVQDAFNLGWKLAHVVQGGEESWLDSYEKERLPVAAAVLGLSRKLHQSRSLKRGSATDQLGLNYRSSPLSSGNSHGALQPGDRMPDQRLSDGSRLFDHFRQPQPTLITQRDGTRVLIRADGYIASIGASSATQFAGSAVQAVRY